MSLRRGHTITGSGSRGWLAIFQHREATAPMLDSITCNQQQVQVESTGKRVAAVHELANRYRRHKGWDDVLCPTWLPNARRSPHYHRLLTFVLSFALYRRKTAFRTSKRAMISCSIAPSYSKVLQSMVHEGVDRKNHCTGNVGIMSSRTAHVQPGPSQSQDERADFDVQNGCAEFKAGVRPADADVEVCVRRCL